MKRKIGYIITGILMVGSLAFGYTRDWSTAIPIDHSLNNLWPGYIRQAKADVAERLTDMFYGFASGETNIGIKSLRFIDQVSNPSTVTDTIQLYGKAVNSKTELFFKDEDGNAVQLTTAGNFNGIPAGTIVPYAGSSTPNGYLLCDGSAVSRTTYAELFTAISTNWGAGNGTTTFNVPDLRDSYPVGKGTTYSTLAASVGSATHDHGGVTGSHTLDISEIPAHTHSLTGTRNNGNASSYTYSFYDAGASAVQTGATGSAGGGGGHTHTITSASNYPPSKVINYLIKY